MHKDGPAAHSLRKAAPKNFPGLRACLLLLGAGLLVAATLPASASENKSSGTQTASSQNVGAETCATCHADEAKNISSNPHSKIELMHGKLGVTCESCHGPGKAHVDAGGDPTKILNPAKATSKEVDEKCLSCHAGTHPNFLRSPHAKAGVSCISCHSVHASKDEAKLLKAPQPKLCYQCHTDVKPSFSMPFHHKVNEGLVKCNDCHDVHGTFSNNNLRTTADQNAICTKCHTETRGPFVFEHAAVKAEGCMGCHTPHGSQNARLLNVPTVNMLCNQCHSPVAEGAVHGVGQGTATVQPCISCHTQIHGSNVSQAFIR
ncbi:MAG TPA: DmsE family decaheme c-type cytochrome [Terracidiphilus sp.]|nr:DmsE family decaheme c-type cytochrome [Terracidiphilus sp.]